MVHPRTARASAITPIPRASSDPNTLTAAALSWTLRDLDRRQSEFMRYAEDILGHTADTRRNYKGTYNNFRTYLQSFPPNEFIHRIFDIEGWVGWNRRRGIGDITLNTYWRQLRPFFRYLEQIDGIQNPYQFIKPPRVTSVLPKARSFEECKHILLSAEQYSWATVYERWRAVAIVGVLLYAGLRRREVLGLRAQDINVRSSTITVLFGKGGKQRTVYMAPELRDIIVRYIHEREYRRYAGPGFFAAMDTGQPISLSTFRRIVNVVRRASGIKFSVHSLRHSFITMALRNGVPIHVVRDLAGHSSIVTTAGYLRVFDSDKQREIRKLSFL